MGWAEHPEPTCSTLGCSIPWRCVVGVFWRPGWGGITPSTHTWYSRAQRGALSRAQKRVVRGWEGSLWATHTPQP